MSYVLELNKLAKRALKDISAEGISQLIHDQFWVVTQDYIRHFLTTVECNDFEL